VKTEIERLLKRQASWQIARRNIPWTEKLAISVRMRKDIEALLAKDKTIDGAKRKQNR
jgi:hypothetical protein